jgi:hypothetical protein
MRIFRVTRTSALDTRDQNPETARRSGMKNFAVVCRIDPSAVYI